MSESQGFDEVKDDSDLHTDTNAPDDAAQGTVADQDAEGKAPQRDAGGEDESSEGNTEANTE